MIPLRNVRSTQRQRFFEMEQTAQLRPTTKSLTAVRQLLSTTCRHLRQRCAATRNQFTHSAYRMFRIFNASYMLRIIRH